MHAACLASQWDNGSLNNMFVFEDVYSEFPWSDKPRNYSEHATKLLQLRCIPSNNHNDFETLACETCKYAVGQHKRWGNPQNQVKKLQALLERISRQYYRNQTQTIFEIFECRKQNWKLGDSCDIGSNTSSKKTTMCTGSNEESLWWILWYSNGVSTSIINGFSMQDFIWLCTTDFVNTTPFTTWDSCGSPSKS